MMLRSPCERDTLETMTNHTTTTTTVFETLWDAPMSARGFIRLTPSTVTLVGQQTGKVTALSIRPNEALGGNVVVLHTEGASYWRGRGEQGYAPASVQTVLVQSEPKSTGVGEAVYRYVVLSQADDVKSTAPARALLTQHVAKRLGVTS